MQAASTFVHGLLVCRSSSRSALAGPPSASASAVAAEATRISLGRACLRSTSSQLPADATRTTTASCADPVRFPERQRSITALIPQEVAGGSRRHPRIPATPGAERPAHAMNPRRSPPSPQTPRPACHAGGRGFESRRSCRKPANRHFVLSIETANRGRLHRLFRLEHRSARKRPETLVGVVISSHFRPRSTGHKGRLQLHETAGGQGWTHVRSDVLFAGTSRGWT